MAGRIEADGERWEVHLSREAPHPGVRAMIFRCLTNSSVGWRVVEVAEREFPAPSKVDDLTEPELQALYDRAQPFDYTHDPHARPDHIGDPPVR